MIVHNMAPVQEALWVFILVSDPDTKRRELTTMLVNLVEANPPPPTILRMFIVAVWKLELKVGRTTVYPVGQ